MDICIGYGENAVRIEFFGDEVDTISVIDPVTGAFIDSLDQVSIYPANNFVTTKERSAKAVSQIQDDMVRQCEYFQEIGKPLEAKRLKQRVEYDLEMIKEMGYCPGIENYSRYFDGLIEYGFRLPAAADNRPLKFDEFEAVTGQKVYVSATPGDYELEKSEGLVVEQVVRPTGLLDPPIEVRPTKNQVDDLLEEIRVRAEKDERVLVTTLTKRMAEELEKYFTRMGVRCRYIHSDVDTLERVEIIEDFKNGLFDVLVGVNLLREGLDIPTVSLVAILDADKEGFLRSGRALTQTAGRAARNVNGLVIMYADTITQSMQETIYETDRRRAKQMEYNKKHNIGKVSAANSYEAPHYIPDPSDLGKGSVSVGLGHDSVRPTNSAYKDGYIQADLAAVLQDPVIRSMTREQVEKAAEQAKKNMQKAASDLDFLAAAKYRDEMWALKDISRCGKSRL